jgi:hypothetical protein
VKGLEPLASRRASSRLSAPRARDPPARAWRPAAAAAAHAAVGAQRPASQEAQRRTPRCRAVACLSLQPPTPHSTPPPFTPTRLPPHPRPQGNPDSDSSWKPSSSGGLAPGMKIPNFGSLAETNATIKVPKGMKRRPPQTASAFGTEAVSPFVRIEGDQFDKDCRPFYPTGFNAFELFLLAARESTYSRKGPARRGPPLGVWGWGHRRWARKRLRPPPPGPTPTASTSHSVFARLGASLPNSLPPPRHDMPHRLDPSHVPIPARARRPALPSPPLQRAAPTRSTMPSSRRVRWA